MINNANEFALDYHLSFRCGRAAVLVKYEMRKGSPFVPPLA